MANGVLGGVRVVHVAMRVRSTTLVFVKGEGILNLGFNNRLICSWLPSDRRPDFFHLDSHSGIYPGDTAQRQPMNQLPQNRWSLTTANTLREGWWAAIATAARGPRNSAPGADQMPAAAPSLGGGGGASGKGDK